MNRVTTNCMQNAIDSLQRKMPYSATWFLMVARVTRERIMNYSKLKDMKVNRENLRSYLSCQLNINATTRYSHTERDRTYTIIHVPEQSECNGNYYFHFHISDSDCLQIQLDEKVTIAYSSYLLTHSQRKSAVEKETNFVNISSYFSERLFNNVHKSMRRMYNSLSKK